MFREVFGKGIQPGTAKFSGQAGISKVEWEKLFKLIPFYFVSHSGSSIF
jgi:hypothetical protein